MGFKWQSLLLRLNHSQTGLQSASGGKMDIQMDITLCVTEEYVVL